MGETREERERGGGRGPEQAGDIRWGGAARVGLEPEEGGYQVKGACADRTWRKFRFRSPPPPLRPPPTHTVPGVQFRCENVPLSGREPLVEFSEE